MSAAALASVVLFLKVFVCIGMLFAFCLAMSELFVLGCWGVCIISRGSNIHEGS